MIEHKTPGENPALRLSVVEEKSFVVAQRLKDFTGEELIAAVVTYEEPPLVILSPAERAKLAKRPVMEFMLGRMVVSESDKNQEVTWGVSESEEQEPIYSLNVRIRGARSVKAATSSRPKNVCEETVPQKLSPSQARRRRKQAAYAREVQEAAAQGLPKPPNPLSRTGRKKIKKLRETSNE